MAAFLFAALGADKAAYGLAAYTLFVLLEAPLGTAGCLAAEAVVMCVVLWNSLRSSAKETPTSPEGDLTEVPQEAAGECTQPSAVTENTERGDSTKCGRRKAAQASSAKLAETKSGARAPAAAALRPSAGSWADQAVQRRKQEEAGIASSAAPASPKSGAAACALAQEAGGASASAAPALKSSAGSWAAAQKRKKWEEASSSDPSDAEFARSVRSLLNKLTVEKFDSLYARLTACGIRTPAHVEILVGEIVEKARAQHHFVKMYAELCARLEGEFAALAECNFKRILFDKCQKSFESSLEPMAEAVVQGNEAGEWQAKRKERMLGNIKLTGELLTRQMLSSNVLISCAEDLLESPPEVDRLECLAVLLQVTGPAFDNPAWARHETLVAIFTTVSSLSQAPSVPSRTRFLLRDVLDLRAAGWVDSRAATRVEGPKSLREVHKEAAAESRFVDKPKREWVPRAEGGWAAGAQPPAHAPSQAALAGRAKQETWRANQATPQENLRSKQAPPREMSWQASWQANQEKAWQANKAWASNLEKAWQLRAPAGANWQRLRTCLDFA